MLPERDTTDVSDFFRLIFDYPGAEGYVHVALFEGGKPIPGGRKFVKWPEERAKLRNLEKNSGRGDLYFSPALYGSRQATRQAALGTFVTWADVDREDAAVPSASLLVESGTPGHIHAYWLAGRLLPTAEAQAWNYYNATAYNADQSGWDITQLLRVPGTLNHKTTPPLPVRLVYTNADVVEAPQGLDTILVPEYRKPDILPKLETILDAHELTDSTLRLLSLDSPPERSDTMYRLACELSEAGLSADEAYVIVEHIDTRWGKFVGRTDREQRLSQLVAKAFESTLTIVDDSETETGPVAPAQPEFDPFEPVGWGDLGRDLPPLTYVVEGVLLDKGFMLITGDTGVGKSQTAMNLTARIVLGAKEWAGFKINRSEKQQKVIYISLEMDQRGIKLSSDLMSTVLTHQQIDQLTKNLLFVATLAPFKLDADPLKGVKGRHKVARQKLTGYIEKHQPTGIVIDTLRAAVSESLQEEKAINKLVTWIQGTLREKYGMWVMLLVHPRKEASGQKRKVITMDEVYGSRVIGDIVDTGFSIERVAGHGDDIRQLVNIKARYTARHATVTLRRTPSLWLESTEAVAPVTQERRLKANEDFTVEDDTFEVDGDW